MRVFENKSIFKKLIIVLFVIMLFSFCVPKTVRAKDDEMGIGGKLLDPVMSMLVGLGDGAISLVQKTVLQKDVSIIEVDTRVDDWKKIIGIIVAVTVAVGGLIALVSTGGGALVVVKGLVTVAIRGALYGVVAFAVSGYALNAILPEDFVLPMIELSPYEIFANQIPIFDVDFFNPMNSKIYDERQMVEKSTEPQSTKQRAFVIGKLEKEYGYNENLQEEAVSSEQEKIAINIYDNNLKVQKWEYNGKKYAYYYIVRDGKRVEDWGVVQGEFSKTRLKYLNIKQVSEYKYEIEFTDNIMNYNSREELLVQEDETIEVGEKKEVKSTAALLKSTISNWYVVLRDISLVALLSVLVYVGIRIIISSTAGDKAKYKQMLMDWVIAMCLLFVMHYIMAASNMVVKKFINLIDATDLVNDTAELPEEVSGQTISDEGVVMETGPELFKIDDEDKAEKAYKILVEERNMKDVEGFFTEDHKTLYWPTKNFTAQVRMKLQYVDKDDENGNYAYAGIGYKLIYCILILYTIIFIFTYLKRVIYMAFLTLIAPLVALTYPIDKMNDGQAQAFNRWFKEYIFNLLIQPLHLILYMVLIGSAYTFASENIVYTVIALGFMMPAEKLLRSFFGFEKAHTPGFLAGSAGAAIMMNGVNKLLGKPPHKDGNKGKALNGSESSEGDSKINFKKSLPMSDLYSINGKDDSATIGSNKVPKIPKTTRTKNVNSATKRALANNALKIARKNSAANSNSKPINRQIPNSANAVKGNMKDRTIRGKRSLRRGMGSLGGRIQMKAADDHTLRKLAGIGTGLAGAAAAATVGGIVGLTSGDPSKIAQYMGAAAMGGYKLADGIPEGLSDLNETRKEYKDAFDEGYYDEDEYKEKKYNEYVKEKQKDIKFRNEIAKETNYDKDETDRIINEVMPQCAKYGLTDTKEILTVAALSEKDYSPEEAMGNTTFVKKYGKDTSDLGNKDEEDLMKTIENRVIRNNPKGTSKEDIDRQVVKIRKGFDAASKIYFK